LILRLRHPPATDDLIKEELAGAAVLDHLDRLSQPADSGAWFLTTNL
jgi:hypothetical protein